MSHIIEIDAIDLVLNTAHATLGACESPVNSNAGPYVEAALALCGLGKGYPWCAAQVAKVGIAALGAKWPVPHTAGCQALYEWGLTKNIVQSLPQLGDIFLLWEESLDPPRFGHTGFIRLIGDKGAHGTSEGNTNSAGSREGWLVAEKVRTFGAKDRFLRWYDLLPATP